MSQARVGIYRLAEPAYSDSWIDAPQTREGRALRDLASLMGSPAANLLSNAVHPGDRVVIKPNWVEDRHARGGDLTPVITHSSVVRAVVDLVYETLQGKGTIIIADAPVWGCDFTHLLEINQVKKIVQHYRRCHDFKIEIRDLRQVARHVHPGAIKKKDRIMLKGDPEGYSVVDLQDKSAFVGMPSSDRLYGDDYDRTETVAHHNGSRHEYLVSRTILTADVLISIPKLKTHAKVGATLNAKGMVGINGNKNWVAHYRIGSPSEGGDELPDSESSGIRTKTAVMHALRGLLLAKRSRAGEIAYDAILRAYRVARPVLGSVAQSSRSFGAGEWHGNDTAWRMCADLARIALFADANGVFHETPQRRFFSIVDGIVAGEGDGPLAPDPKPAGVLLAGENLLAVDLAAVRLMGFDWRKLRYLGWLMHRASPSMGVRAPQDVEIVSNVPEWIDILKDSTAPNLCFRPPAGWLGQIELHVPRTSA